MRCSSDAGPFAEDRDRSRAQIVATLPIDARHAVVHGDEVAAARGRSRCPGSRKQCSRRLEVDAVQDQVEVVVVGLDLGMVQLAERVFDRELVEVKDVA